MKNYNAKTAIKLLAEKTKKTIFKDYPMETKNNVNDDKFREELRKAITEAFNVHGEKLEKVLRIFMEKHKAMK
jgi:hypothetical protein